mgnify:CR=1 FL=1
MKRFLVASSLATAFVFLSGCASWQAERQAAHDSANERTQMIGRTVETLSGATRTVTTDTLVDDQDKPFVRETVTTTPGDRKLVSVGFTLEPGASLEFRNNGTGSALVEIGIGEPVASMVNALNDALMHAEVSPDELMRTFAPKVMDTLETLGIGVGGAWAVTEFSKNNQPTIVEQPPPLVIQPEPEPAL